VRVGYYLQTVPGFSRERDENAARWREYGALIYEDVNRDGPIWTMRDMLEDAAEDGCDWALIMQDDAVPFDGWDQELGPALVHSPGPLLSLSHFASVGEKAAAAGYAYGQPGMWGPAWAHRRDAVLGTLALYPRIFEINPRYSPADGPAYIWSLLAGHPPVFTSRALFDHPPWRSSRGHPTTGARRPYLSILHDGPHWTAPGVWQRPVRDFETEGTKEMLRRLREA
jgi:hypothetical protein